MAGEIIGSVDAFDGVNEVVDADGDELGLGKSTPSKEMPLTSSFTTNCGSPVDEFSVYIKRKEGLLKFLQRILDLVTHLY